MSYEKESEKRQIERLRLETNHSLILILFLGVMQHIVRVLKHYKHGCLHVGLGLEGRALDICLKFLGLMQQLSQMSAITQEPNQGIFHVFCLILIAHFLSKKGRLNKKKTINEPDQH
jgi:hypothetical protein